MTKLGAEGLALTSLVLVVLHQLLPDPSPAWLIPLLTPALVAALIRTA